MADSEGGALPPSKKRVAGREISRDNPGLDDDDEPEGEMGTFKRASEEVLATRRIVKVRRQQSKPLSTNPFAGLQLVSSSKSLEDSNANVNAADKQPLDDDGSDPGKNEYSEDAENCDPTNSGDVGAKNNDGNSDEAASKNNGVPEVGPQESSVQIENEKEVANGQKSVGEQDVDNCNKESKEVEETGKPEDQSKDTDEASGSFSSFQQLSSRQNAFTGLAGTGFSSSPFSFGLTPQEGSVFSAGSGSLLGQSGENFSIGIVGLGGGGSLQLFGSVGTEDSIGGGVSKPVMQEVPIETGEENETAVFSADAIFFEYVDGGWKERGKGELKLNINASGSEKARLVMRARGNYRLILNANLFPDMSLKSMDKRGVTFACVNSATEGKAGFSTFALKFKEASILEDFRDAVETYKGKKDDDEKAP